MPRKRILVNIFTTGIYFLLLALSFSRDDDLGRGVKGDASLYSFPVKLGYSMLRKRLHRSLTWPAGVLCAALYRCGTPHCLRLQHNAATASYQTIQPEATEDNLRLSKLSLGVRKPKPKIYQSWLGLWFFLLRRWSVVKLGLNICLFLLSCCRCLLGCCCESITCFFIYGHWWR